MKQRKGVSKNRSNKAKQGVVELKEGKNTGLCERRLIRVLEWEGEEPVPSCSHGPCLLFEDSSEGDRWFSCAVFRSDQCRFRVRVDGSRVEAHKSQSPIRSQPLEEYGLARRSYSSILSSGGSPYWCRKCTNYVEDGSRHNHPTIGPVREWIPPLQSIDAIREDGGQAQYWFSNDTLDLVERVLQKQRVDSVLCIGCPSIFERLRVPDKNIRCFLLDYDDRLSRFYSSEEFARYSMLAHHFYIEESELLLKKFLSECNRVALVCDPPFGVITSPLAKSIARLSKVFADCSASNSDRRFHSLVFLPLFVGKHLLTEGSYAMVDYKVTYENHREYCKAEKTPVRIFTDLPLSEFELPSAMGYKFCGCCNRWIAKENRHCKKCRSCTTKFGPTYIHCDKCQRCVKPSYSHCPCCDACHLKGRCDRSSRR